MNSKSSEKQSTIILLKYHPIPQNDPSLKIYLWSNVMLLLLDLDEISGFGLLEQRVSSQPNKNLQKTL